MSRSVFEAFHVCLILASQGTSLAVPFTGVIVSGKKRKNTSGLASFPTSVVDVESGFQLIEAEMFTNVIRTSDQELITDSSRSPEVKYVRFMEHVFNGLAHMLLLLYT